MVKELSYNQNKSLSKIIDLYSREGQAKLDAHNEAVKLERRLRAEVEARTNEAIAEAHLQWGVPISTIAKVALNTTSRNATYRRLKAATGEAAIDESGKRVVTYDPSKSYRGTFDLVLNNKGTEYQEYILTVENFSHPDLPGRGYSGTVTYHELPVAIGGTLVDGDGNEVEYDDLDVTLNIFDIPEVRQAWREIDAE